MTTYLPAVSSWAALFSPLRSTFPSSATKTTTTRFFFRLLSIKITNDFTFDIIIRLWRNVCVTISTTRNHPLWCLGEEHHMLDLTLRSVHWTLLPRSDLIVPVPHDLEPRWLGVSGMSLPLLDFVLPWFCIFCGDNATIAVVLITSLDVFYSHVCRRCHFSWHCQHARRWLFSPQRLSRKNTRSKNSFNLQNIFRLGMNSYSASIIIIPLPLPLL